MNEIQEFTESETSDENGGMVIEEFITCIDMDNDGIIIMTRG